MVLKHMWSWSISGAAVGKYMSGAVTDKDKPCNL